MQSPLQRILVGTVFFISTLLIAITGYTLLQCPLITSVYMVIITVFGVGYGEICPVQSPAQRIFTIFVIVAGYGSAAYTVGGFIQMIAEGEIKQVLEQRRKTRDIANLQEHTIVCGYGRIGQVLAHKLAAANQPFVIIDQDPERLTDAEELGYRVCQGNASDEQVLQTAGIERAKTLATVLPDDALNVFITLTARGLNPQLTIVARGELPSTEKKLLLAGANHVVSPASISGMRMANLITHPNTIQFLDQNEDRARLNELLAQMDVQVDELRIPADSPLVGGTIADLEVRGKGTFIVVALRKINGEFLTHPGHEVRLDAGDTVIVLGHRGDIPNFKRLYNVKRKLRYRGARS
ncbi:potassium channel family protein [Thermocoleostomius sinensis]|uniref:Potassium channel protein n=1 Tax=Thermocoleostomius sinensis A174 TaxID=2016057 RepID=A0A9E9C931_9CYAN|nr:potassium channel protein [Thermocoleostomius sinensis]WAL60978.1 potassium channel protein [Thermocoleostomius sinensis A174]